MISSSHVAQGAVVILIIVALLWSSVVNNRLSHNVFVASVQTELRNEAQDTVKSVAFRAFRAGGQDE